MRRSFSSARTAVALCLSLPFTGQAFGVEAQSNHYRQGTSAFRQGDYVEALKHFNNAADAMEAVSDPLLYNLGVTHYKLAQYDRSKEYFERLLASEEWSGLARYNLALVLERQGEEQAAIENYRHVARNAGNAKLRYLAEHKRDELMRDAARRDERVALFVGMTAGYDDNAMAFPEQLQESASASADAFTELYAYGQAYVYGERGSGLLLHGYAFSRQYREFSSFDVDLLHAGLSHEYSVSDWVLDVGGELQRASIDGEVLMTTTRIALRAHRYDGNNEYVFSWVPARHSAGLLYPQLEGSSQQLEAKWRHLRGDWRVQAAYRLELNDREDLAEDDLFFSYSPTRNRLAMEINWFASERFTWTAGASFEHSQYRGENRVIDTNGEVRAAVRISDAVESWLHGEFLLSEGWRAHAEYRYQSLEDTFLLYQYDRNILQFGLEYTF